MVDGEKVKGQDPFAWERYAQMSIIQKEASKIAQEAEFEVKQFEQNRAFLGDEFVMAPSAKQQYEFARRIETSLFKCFSNLAQMGKDIHDAFPDYTPGREAEQDANIALWQFPNVIILKTPYLRKSFNPKQTSQVAFSPMLDWLPGAINPDKFPKGPIFHYVMSIYPEGTNHELIIDADNINTKAYGDPITQMLGLDDNGQDVALLIYALESNELPAGSYTIMMPQTDSVFAPKQLLELIKKHIGEPEI